MVMDRVQGLEDKRVNNHYGRLVTPGEGNFNIKYTGVRLTLPKAGASGENTVSKNEGSFGEKPNFGSKLGGIG